jgi:hypothetical protein
MIEIEDADHFVILHVDFLPIPKAKPELHRAPSNFMPC